MGKKVRPLRSQSIRYGAPVAQPAGNDAKTVTKDNPAWVRLGDGRVRKVDAQEILSIKAGDVRPEGRVARYGVFTERTGMLHSPRGRHAGNPESYLHSDLSVDGNVLVRKAGEVVSAMFPGRRSYPRIPSPNPHLRAATHGFAQFPQRPSNGGMAGANTPVLANREAEAVGRGRGETGVPEIVEYLGLRPAGRKGWVTFGDGRKVYIGEGWRSTPATPAAKISREDWARGVVAIAEIERAGGSKVPWLAGIERAERQARRILNPRRKKGLEKRWVTLGDGRRVEIPDERAFGDKIVLPPESPGKQDMAEKDRIELANLYHTARALVGDARYDRLRQTARWFSRAHPEVPETVAYAWADSATQLLQPIDEKVIRRVGNKWVLFTADGKRRLGTHESKRDAHRQEAAIEASKRSRKGAEPERATGVAMRQVGAGAERLAPLHGKEKLPAHLRPYDPGHRVAGRANRIAVARQMFRERGPHRPGAKHVELPLGHENFLPLRFKPTYRGWVGMPADDHVPGRIERPLKKIVGVSAWPYGINPYGMVPLMAPGLEWIPLKQGRRPVGIDYPKAGEIPSLRTEHGREAMSEMAKNPPATRDPDPWRAPSARPRDPSPASKVNLRDPVPENGDPGLRAHMEGAGRTPGVRAPKGDDTRNVLLGAGRPMGRTVAPESHGREMSAHDVVSADPEDYRIRKPRPEPARGTSRPGGLTEEDGK